MATPIPAQVQKTPALRPRDLIGAVEFYAKTTGAAIMIHGDPGVGKSQIVQQVADRMFAENYGYKIGGGRVQNPKGKFLSSRSRRPWFKDVRAALLDQVDLRGVPSIQDNGEEPDTTVWNKPEFLPTDDRGGILFLDEINRGSEAVANALFQLCLSGEVGEHQIPRTWLIMSAINDRDAGVRKLPSALNARFMHLDAGTDLEDVLQLANDRDWSEEVVAFLRFQPQLLQSYEPKDRVSPNPRSWEFVSSLLKGTPPKALLLPLVAGQLGQGAALSFTGFLNLYKNLPDIDGIFANPKSAPVPKENGVLWAVGTALSRRVTDKTFPAMMEYLNRVPVEYRVASVVDAVRANPNFMTTKTFTDFGTKHKDLL